MQYLPLLRKHLKSDEILELLETHDMEVIYEFDRTHENIPDEYCAKSLELGLELVFDEHQTLKTLFIHLNGTDGFAAADVADSDVTLFESKNDAAAFASAQGVEISEGIAELFGVERDWIRFEYKEHSVHYEFQGGSLGLVTLATR
jgi:hypothetical protein